MKSSIETRDAIELRIPCRAEWVALARLAIAAVANRLKLSVEEIEDVKLAVAEACTAVIQHETHGETLLIEAHARPDALAIRVRDEGRHETHHEAAPEPLVLDGARTEGLGVFLIRTLMDEVSYDVDPQRGTDLTMVKKLSR